LLTRLERSSMKLENMRDVLLDVARLESGATQPRITDFPLGRVFESLRLTSRHRRRRRACASNCIRRAPGAVPTRCCSNA
ncbi:hypothetical protein ABTF49_19115, partial [Acinetobacter baumannii]